MLRPVLLLLVVICCCWKDGDAWASLISPTNNYRIRRKAISSIHRWNSNNNNNNIRLIHNSHCNDNNSHDSNNHGMIGSFTTRLYATTDDDNDDDDDKSSAASTVTAVKKNKCNYKNLATDKWRPRKLLDDLKVGDVLSDCYQIQELYDAKTGPKLFFECGIGRLDGKGRWQMVSGMLRLNEIYSYSKKSVIRKKARKAFDKNRSVTLYVSKASKDNGRLEISIDNPKKRSKKKKKLTSASTLKVGYEMEGTVVSVKPYGVFVDIGANRLGLLHIQTVADLYGHYIAKEKGLILAGLELNARIRVAVQTNQRKRLALDFPPDVKKGQVDDTTDDDDVPTTSTTADQTDDNNMDKDDEEDDDDEEADMWAAYAADEYGNYEDDYDNDDKSEDRDIEDSLGLGTY